MRRRRHHDHARLELWRGGREQQVLKQVEVQEVGEEISLKLQLLPIFGYLIGRVHNLW